MGRQNLHFVMPLVHELKYQKVVLCVVVAKLLPHVSITLKRYAQAPKAIGCLSEYQIQWIFVYYGNPRTAMGTGY